MPYYENVPQVGQQINTSRPQIQANFQAIQTALGRNHVTFTAAEPNWGKHNLAEFVRQAVDHDPAANNISMYCKNYGPSARSELYIKRTGITAFPITARKPIALYEEANPATDAVTRNWTMINERLVIVFGQIKLTGGDGGTPLDLPGPVNFTQRPYVFITPINAILNTAATYVRYTGENRALIYGQLNTRVAWMAIGQIPDPA